MSEILTRILEVKRDEVASARSRDSQRSLLVRAEQAEPARGFAKSMRSSIEAGRAAIIAEAKRASPSKGVIRAEFDAAAIARSYQEHGASCLSVLTDLQFFKGTPDDLRAARAACTLPVLRKDFMVDEYQLAEARVMGADAILLIVAALDDHQLADFEAVASGIGLDVLVEVHDADELDRALRLRTPLVGINNRNLRTFETRLDTTLDLMSRVGPERILVTESGVLATDDVKRLRGAGVNAFLVGEAFMRAPDPGAELARLFAA
ncbi:indole-3-glycerol phosphate synthase TrpC [soil metagenome]